LTQGDPPKDWTDSEKAAWIRSAKQTRIAPVGADSARLLKFTFNSLCSLRATATKLEQPFLSYLIEMAALEARHQLTESQSPSGHAVDFIEQRD
jgi:hypothetical protein